MTDRAPSPTPSERKRLDADAKAKEQEEQSKLPYKWTQTIADLEVTIEVPGNFKGKDLDVVIKKTGVKAGIRGKEAIIEVCLNEHDLQ
jgi:HSP20 family molecular chaperone IbpA